MESPAVSFTGVVVVCNEDERLRECLESLSFCSEVLVIDLESKDRSVEIARDCGARVLNHERVPTAGVARKYGSKHAKNDWTVFLDPDEVFPASLYPQMCHLIHKNRKIGRIFIPWKFYLKGEPLEGTKWGGQKAQKTCR
jgi:glycosyltransferase involved in cell wall biosynthesis